MVFKKSMEKQKKSLKIKSADIFIKVKMYTTKPRDLDGKLRKAADTTGVEEQIVDIMALGKRFSSITVKVLKAAKMASELAEEFDFDWF